MHYRKGSPLGLTIEELDDRGLLDGGSVPSYYTSMKQRTRRPLELKKRSSRLQDRNAHKFLNGVFHVLRALVRRGLNLEGHFRAMEVVDKKNFFTTLKRIGMPYSSRDLMEIAQRYTLPTSELVDYESFLRDAEVAGGSGPQELTDLGSYTNVLLGVKDSLVLSLTTLGKSVDDMYKMFAQWDSEGSGTVTATQFLRVLARLHVDLSDQDQDFLVELLDFNGMGRVEFESLLNYCFSSKHAVFAGGVDGLVSPVSGAPYSLRSSSIVDDGFSIGVPHADSLSLVSTDGGRNSNEAGSVGSNGQQTQGKTRPKTATGKPWSGYGADPEAVWERGEGSLSSAAPKRPLTASARVSNNKPEGAADTTVRERPVSGDPIHGLVVDLPDDVINDNDNDDDVGMLTPQSLLRKQKYGFAGGAQGEAWGGGYDANGYDGSLDGSLDGALQDAASFNDNTLLTIDQDELFFGSPRRDSSYHRVSKPYTGQGSGEPYEHLALLATQTLSTVREMILKRHQSGKSLRDIFQHFDRREASYFDSRDLIQATADLLIETSERVSVLAISMMALDGIDKVSYGEFKVFVLDPDHYLLQRSVEQQIAQQLERQGRGYQQWLYNIFWSEDGQEGSEDGPSAYNKQLLGLVSSKAFTAAVDKTGAKLTSSEIDRLAVRFDVHGSGHCSASRFLGMVQGSSAWREAERAVALQEEASEEAASLRHHKRQGDVAPEFQEICDELISMAEYLGIRVLTERHLLWIASDALRAPLPMSWSMKTDRQGRQFFYNHISGQSRWDHPLDPHFRKLRDQHRRQEQESRARQHSSELAIARYPVPNASIGFGGPGARLVPPAMDASLVPPDARPPAADKFSSAAANAAAATRANLQARTLPATPLEKGTALRPSSSNPSIHPRPQPGVGRQQRPQSALPVQGAAGGGPLLFPASKPLWRDRTQGERELRSLYNLQHAPVHQLTAAPASGVVAPSKLSLEGDISDFEKRLDTKKLLTPEALYSSTYFEPKASSKSKAAAALPLAPTALAAAWRQGLLGDAGGGLPLGLGGSGKVAGSSARSRAQTANPSSKRPSAVDRALGYSHELLAGLTGVPRAEPRRDKDDAGHAIPQQELQRNEQLEGMYGDQIINRLDSIIMNQRESQRRDAPGKKRGKGGIVII